MPDAAPLGAGGRSCHCSTHKRGCTPVPGSHPASCGGTGRSGYGVGRCIPTEHGPFKHRGVEFPGKCWTAAHGLEPCQFPSSIFGVPMSTHAHAHAWETTLLFTGRGIGEYRFAPAQRSHGMRKLSRLSAQRHGTAQGIRTSMGLGLPTLHTTAYSWWWSQLSSSAHAHL
jgi:hypothetical protein